MTRVVNGSSLPIPATNTASDVHYGPSFAVGLIWPLVVS